MANWHEILKELQSSGSTFDLLRRKYLAELHQVTQRNVIAYYSGWLDKPNAPGLHINDSDKNGFMNAIHNLDRKLGLDLILHTPGGDTAATESLVDYLRAMFGTDIRAIVPQLAMSGGTVIACACKEILMGLHSSLGPIDPQMFGGMIPAHALVEEFKRAHREMKEDQSRLAVWQFILGKYQPTWMGEAEKAIKWSEDMTRKWLESGMLKGEPNSEARAKEIVVGLGDHATTLSHARHLSADACKSLGLKIVMLEDDSALQEAVLSVHHIFMHTLSSTGACKIIENHAGVAYVQTMVPAIELRPPRLE